ncbi:MAG TPA: hypothetical protein VFE20_02710, partial [Thermoleophilia bacterium]|nr:hypothetical protein [Thermoleophilia bacterium]
TKSVTEQQHEPQLPAEPDELPDDPERLARKKRGEKLSRWALAIVVVLSVITLAARTFDSDGGVFDFSDEKAEQAAAEAAEAAAAEAALNPVPESLAGLGLFHEVTGPQAVTEVEQLHGKALGAGLDSAWIAKYGQQGEATLWISRSNREEDAVEMLDRMTVLIEDGGTPFTGLENIGEDAAPIYQLDGMGQRHYYFRSGKDLYWLAAPPAQAEAALQELLTSSGRGSAVSESPQLEEAA